MIDPKRILLLTSLMMIFFSCNKKGKSISSQEKTKMQFANRNIPFKERTTFQVGDDSFEINYKPYRSGGGRLEHYNVSILKNRKNITGQFIKGEFELTVKNPLKNTQLVSPDKKYFFVPMQYGAKLIRTKDLSYFQPLFRHGNDNNYLGNIFYSNYLLAIYTKTIHINHLESGIGCSVYFKGNQKIIWAERTEEGNLFIKLKEGEKVVYKELLIPSLEFKNAPPHQVVTDVPFDYTHVKHESIYHHTKTYKVNGHVYEITVLDLDEPNNGRMLERVSFKIDEVDVTEKYLTTWNCFPISTSGHKKISPDGNHLLLPHESGAVIVHTKDGSFVQFPLTGSKANRFTKLSSNASYFEAVGSQSYMLAHIGNKIALKIYFQDARRLKGAGIPSEPILELTPYEYNTPNFKINLKTLEFIDEKE